MSFDPLVTHPGRLSILTELARETGQEFVRLRARTRLTDGNLATHARRLQAGGLIDMTKRFEQGKPVTRFTLTPTGQAALSSHVQRLLASLTAAHQSLPSEAISDGPEAGAPDAEDDWVD